MIELSICFSGYATGEYYLSHSAEEDHWVISNEMGDSCIVDQEDIYFMLDKLFKMESGRDEPIQRDYKFNRE